MPSEAARLVAQRLFVREAGDQADDATLVATADRIGAGVSAGLSRWFGPYGSIALVTRALAGAQSRHPALAPTRVTGVQSACLTGLAESARLHGAAAMRDGVITMLAVLADLIGRLIGDDLALRVLEQSIAPTATGGSLDGAGPASDELKTVTGS